MGLMDKVKGWAGKNPDKVQQGIEKGGDAIDQRTGGKHADKVDKAQDAASKHLGGGQQQPGQSPP